MGVPGFFRWLAKNHKDRIIAIKKPRVDYLFIDMNSLIHPQCFSVLAENPDLTDRNLLESMMLQRVVDYLDSVVKEADPQKQVMIAIDGVAPMAKIKQQRSRRFRSVNDHLEKEKIYKRFGKTLSSWSNVAITPGTDFMHKIRETIHKYAKTSKVKVVFSSANEAGEGEHKILQYIRQHVPSGPSCMTYGLDADLLFLSLAADRPDMYLMRERQEVSSTDDKNGFVWVAIDGLREAIVKSFKNRGLDGAVDEDTLVNDFIVLCYLLGNDFIPNLPGLSIHNKGIEILVNTYINVHKKHQPLVDKATGAINKELLYNILGEISKQEKELVMTQTKRRYQPPPKSPLERAMWKYENIDFQIFDPVRLGDGPPNEWKQRYYKHHFLDRHGPQTTAEEVCREYVEGIAWVSVYYFCQAPSWRWWYPYERAPFVSDLVAYLSRYPENEIVYPSKKHDGPIPSIAQLLIVTPRQLANEVIPLKEFRRIIDLPGIREMYPPHFRMDLLGHTKMHQAEPILKPILLKEILKAVSSVPQTKDVVKYYQKVNQKDS